MTFCAKCGAMMADDSAFCGGCGQATGPQVGAAAFSRSSTTTEVVNSSSGTGLSANMAAALAYALGAITGVLFLVLDPYKSNRFIRFHAMQSILFSIACVIFAIVWSIVWGILASFAGFWILTVDLPLRLLVGLGIFLLWLFVMYQAYSEREYRIPWIGDIAAKQLG